MNQPDTIETFAGCTIQHGAASDRVYLMHIGPDAGNDLPQQLFNKATTHGYSKIFAKVPDDRVSPFLTAGYTSEATVAGFYNGQTDAQFVCKYLRADRAHETNATDLNAIIEICKTKPPAAKSTPLPIRQCTTTDCTQIAAVYAQVFETYPFPIHRPAYIEETMQSHVDYFAIEESGRIVGLASAEMDAHAQNAEMTDFATLPSHRGHGYALHLLHHMEQAMAKKQILTGYTIARAVSAGMNITFAKAGYQFGGRLKNNTQISGQIESMNVWHKRLG